MKPEKSPRSGIGRQLCGIDTQSPKRLGMSAPDKVRTGLLRTIAALVAILALFALGHRIDSKAEDEDQAAGQQAQQAARQLRDRDMADRLARAYEQGQLDAMRVLKQTPEGLALAQACMAWGAASQPSPTELVQAAPAKKGA
jgi:hypothetical protein